MKLTETQKAWIYKHQRILGIGLLLGWFAINVVVLATTVLMEYSRMGKSIKTWEPFCWEISSVFMILILIPCVFWAHEKWIAFKTWKTQLIFHGLAALISSIIHVVGMVAIRKLCYWVNNDTYDFGNPMVEFFYEFRKDLQTYITLGIVIVGYQIIVRRLNGEASILEEECNATLNREEGSSPTKPPSIFLVKKLGREFLIKVDEIEWIEAAGNYANLHIRNKVFPMRITMDKLESLLPHNFIRVHRSTIVETGQIQEVLPLDSGDYQINLRNGYQLTLSRRYREKFKSRFEA